MNLRGDTFACKVNDQFYISTACDDRYLLNHAQELTVSCAINKNNFHLHMINPSETSFTYANKLKIIFNEITKNNVMKITYNYEKLCDDPDKIRTYYACARFLVAPLIIEQGVNLLLVDSDCFIMKPVIKPNTQIGLFLRDPLPNTQGWEQEGSKIAAGVVYYSHEALLFSKEVASTINRGPFQWFLDQRALNEIYQKYKNELTITQFNNEFMDWEFVENTTIWTGKGQRKYTNQTYLNKKKEYENVSNLIKSQIYPTTCPI